MIGVSGGPSPCKGQARLAEPLSGPQTGFWLPSQPLLLACRVTSDHSLNLSELSRINSITSPQPHQPGPTPVVQHRVCRVGPEPAVSSNIRRTSVCLSPGLALASQTSRGLCRGPLSPQKGRELLARQVGGGFHVLGGLHLWGPRRALSELGPDPPEGHLRVEAWTALKLVPQWRGWGVGPGIGLSEARGPFLHPPWGSLVSNGGRPGEVGDPSLEQARSEPPLIQGRELGTQPPACPLLVQGSNSLAPALGPRCSTS